MKNILSLDGGGYRGLLQATLLERLHAAQPKIFSQTAVFAGTSIGAIAASALAKGLSPKTVGEVLEEIGPQVFDNPWYEKVEELWGLRRAKHKNTRLKAALKKIFGDTRLRDIKKKLLVTSFNMRHLPSGADTAFYRPIVLHNINRGSYQDTLVWEACLASAAAPTYFPPYSPQGFDSGLIDGGVWGNNPAMAVVSQMLRGGRGISVGQLNVLSVGTGYNMKSSRVKSSNWGLYQWVKKGHLLDILTGDATTGAIHYYTETLLGPHYHRLQPHLKKPIDMDDARPVTTRKLKSIGQAMDLQPTLSWLSGFWSHRSSIS